MATWSGIKTTATMDRPGGLLIKHIETDAEAYLQPGDDANMVIGALELGLLGKEQIDDLLSDYLP